MGLLQDFCLGLWFFFECWVLRRFVGGFQEGYLGRQVEFKEYSEVIDYKEL